MWFETHKNRGQTGRFLFSREFKYVGKVAPVEIKDRLFGTVRVEIFDLINHPKAQRCCAWAHQD